MAVLTGTARNCAGFGLIILGILGCMLPILPGIPMILGGAAILGHKHPVVKRFQLWLKAKKEQYK